MGVNTVGTLASELEIQTFVVIEYLKGKGLEIPADSEAVTTFIPERLYTKTKEDKRILEALEEVRVETLEQAINYLKRQVKDWELISFSDEDLQVLEVYYDELSKVEIEKDRRDRLNSYTEIEAIEEESDLPEDNDNSNGDDVKVEERVEYSIYNSTGYVTYTTNLKEARSMAIQYSGYVTDESGNRL